MSLIQPIPIIRPALTTKEQQALQEFANDHGVQWKASLRAAWRKNSATGVLAQIGARAGSQRGFAAEPHSTQGLTDERAISASTRVALRRRIVSDTPLGRLSFKVILRG